MSAEIVVSALKDLSGRNDLDRYDENLCIDIHKRLDAKLRENNMSVTEKTIFARNNYLVMSKWEKVFPAGVSECLSNYFRTRVSWAPKFDPRFPNINQAKNCFINFVDYQRCMKLKGSDYKDCEYFNQAAKSLCPNQWLERYTEQLENGSFPVDL